MWLLPLSHSCAVAQCQQKHRAHPSVLSTAPLLSALQEVQLGATLSSRVTTDTTAGNGLRLCQGRLMLAVRESVSSQKGWSGTGTDCSPGSVERSRGFWSSFRGVGLAGLREDIPVLSPARPCEKMLISFSMGPEIRVQTHLTGLQHICHELVTVVSCNLKFLNFKIKPLSSAEEL